MMNALLKASGGAALSKLLLGQLLFSVFFIGSCEGANWISGPRQANACLERWMTVGALLFPSGMAAAPAGLPATGMARRITTAARKREAPTAAVRALLDLDERR